jgi:hypothetical protein
MAGVKGVAEYLSGVINLDPVHVHHAVEQCSYAMLGCSKTILTLWICVVWRWL